MCCCGFVDHAARLGVPDIVDKPVWLAKMAGTGQLMQMIKRGMTPMPSLPPGRMRCAPSPNSARPICCTIRTVAAVLLRRVEGIGQRVADAVLGRLNRVIGFCEIWKGYRVARNRWIFEVA